jgi:hypothetical protein
MTTGSGNTLAKLEFSAAHSRSAARSLALYIVQAKLAARKLGLEGWITFLGACSYNRRALKSKLYGEHG